METLGMLLVTRPARTLVDLASCLEHRELAMAVEHAWRKRLIKPPWFRRYVQGLFNGRPGMKHLARITEDCCKRSRPMDSAMEVKLWWILKDSGLPLPSPQLPFNDGRGRGIRIDFAYPKERLAVETDGFDTHGPREAFESDCARLTRLAIAGYRHMHFTWSQMMREDEVLEQIRAGLAYARVRGR